MTMTYVTDECLKLDGRWRFIAAGEASEQFNKRKLRCKFLPLDVTTAEFVDFICKGVNIVTSWSWLM